MIQCRCPVTRIAQVAENTYVLTFLAPALSKLIRAGQFLNIRVAEACDPLLRRPYSVYRVDGDAVEIVFNVVGKGSSLLVKKSVGEMLDVIGPLGVPFSLEGKEFDIAVLVGGGLGVAPLPVATNTLSLLQKHVVTFLGFRTHAAVVRTYLLNVHVATDDGTEGFHGTVVSLMEREYELFETKRPMIFACGPTPMLRAVAEFASTRGIPCEVSLEGPMACGFGICQGCPVELRNGGRKYALMCKDGPTFDSREVLI